MRDFIIAVLEAAAKQHGTKIKITIKEQPQKSASIKFKV